MSSTAVVVLSFEIQLLAGPTSVLVKRDSSTRKVSYWAAGCTWQFRQTRQLLFGGDRSRHCEESEVVVGCSFVQYWSPRRFKCCERMELVRTIHVAYILDHCIQLPLAHLYRITGGQCRSKKQEDLLPTLPRHGRHSTACMAIDGLAWTIVIVC